MPRSWNIDILRKPEDVSDPCKQASVTKSSIPYHVMQALYHDTCLVFLIVSNVVFVQALPKIRPKITLYALSTLYETG